MCRSLLAVVMFCSSLAASGADRVVSGGIDVAGVSIVFMANGDVVSGAGTRGPSAPSEPCGDMVWCEVLAVDDAWLELRVTAPARSPDAAKAWLAKSDISLNQTNRKVLGGLVSGIRVALDRLHPGRERPGGIRFIVRLVPQDCAYEEVIYLVRDKSMGMIEIPVIVRDEFTQGGVDSEFVNSMKGGLVINRLAEVIAHEATHVFQLYPIFSGKARMSGAVIADSDSVRYERSASIVAYCVVSALFQTNPIRMIDARNWLEAGPARREEQTDWMSPLYEHLFAKHGSEFVRRLDRLESDDLAYCAMAARRPLEATFVERPMQADEDNVAGFYESIGKVVAPVKLAPLSVFETANNRK